MVYTRFFFSKSWAIQENEGHFWGFCRTILTLKMKDKAGQFKKKKKITKNTGEYRVPVHTPIKKQK